MRYQSTTSKCNHEYKREDYHRYSATVCTKCGHEKDKVRDPAR